MKLIHCFVWLFLVTSSTVFSQRVTVGAKHFTEGYILSEILAQLLEAEGFEVDRKYNLGGTLVCFEALRNGAIDVYPEYTGTIKAEILRLAPGENEQVVHDRLDSLYDLSVTSSLGFSNTYALVMNRNKALEKGIKKISDLNRHSALQVGISYEFLKRQDGWDNLSKFYGLSITPTALEHGLAYQALQNGKIEVTDAYSTDGEIARYDLVVLEDDRHFFPDYQAVVLYSKKLDDKAFNVISRLQQSISESEMQEMNAAAVFHRKSMGHIASDFLARRGFISKSSLSTSYIPDIFSKATRHLALTFLALIMAVMVAVPLGVLIYRNMTTGSIIIYLSGLLQTVPSIALLALMIPLFGIGVVPAVVALFLYALLPILRNTLTGLQAVDPKLKQVAEAMGMTHSQQLRWLELPLALPVIVAGIRTAAGINVGTATLAAFIGAGGLGEFIVTGLALNNTSMILRGAIPAALLAVVVELVFELIQRRITPRYLRARQDET